MKIPQNIRFYLWHRCVVNATTENAIKKSKRQKSPSQRYVPWFSRFNDLATHLSLFHTFRCNLRFYHHHFEFSFPYICEYTTRTHYTRNSHMLVYVYTQLLVVVGLWSFCLCRTTNVYQHFGILKIFRLFFRKLARALLVFSCIHLLALYELQCIAFFVMLLRSMLSDYPLIIMS